MKSLDQTTLIKLWSSIYKILNLEDLKWCSKNIIINSCQSWDQVLFHLMHSPHMSVQALGWELKPEMWIFRFFLKLNLLPADVTLGPASTCSSFPLPSFNITLFPAGPNLTFNFCIIVDQIQAALFKALIRKSWILYRFNLWSLKCSNFRPLLEMFSKNIGQDRFWMGR